MYLITTRSGIKIVVKPVLKKLDWNSGWYGNNQVGQQQYQTDTKRYNAHIATLPAITLPESLQHLPVGSEVEGREQWQVKGPSGEWADCQELTYKKFPSHLTRIILVPYDQEGPLYKKTPSHPPSHEAPHHSSFEFVGAMSYIHKWVRDLSRDQQKELEKMLEEYASQPPKPTEEWVRDAVGFADFIMKNIISFNTNTKKWLFADHSLNTAVPVGRNYTTYDLYNLYKQPPPPDQNKK